MGNIAETRLSRRVVAALISFFLAACVTDAQAKTAQEAWYEITGTDPTNIAFQYIENNKSLPNVLLYGDSISIGYTEYVKSALYGKANVAALAALKQSAREGQAAQSGRLYSPYHQSR